jgi:hypothetical protein
MGQYPSHLEALELAQREDAMTSLTNATAQGLPHTEDASGENLTYWLLVLIELILCIFVIACCFMLRASQQVFLELYSLLERQPIARSLSRNGSSWRAPRESPPPPYSLPDNHRSPSPRLLHETLV